MVGKTMHARNLSGLKEAEVSSLQQQWGKNTWVFENPRRLHHIAWDVVREPMFLLLVLAAVLYFILRQPQEGVLMVAALIFVAAISIFQETKSAKALEALKELTQPKVKVMRDGKEKIIDSTELVPGDVMMLEEGQKVAADGLIVEAHDLSVNESVITGESLPVEKGCSAHPEDPRAILYQGSTVNSGACYARVTFTGNNTVLGKLGKSISARASPKTLLQGQVEKFVRALTVFGFGAFVLIWALNYLRSGDVVASLLFGLTLAMSAIPEEIPVAFSSFMALGAYKIAKLGVISRSPQTIENLGAVSVICFDKTDTITENKMAVKIIIWCPLFTS